MDLKKVFHKVVYFYKRGKLYIEVTEWILCDIWKMVRNTVKSRISDIVNIKEGEYWSHNSMLYPICDLKEVLMNTVQPIRSKEKIEVMKIQLKAIDYKYYMMFTIGVNVGLRISDILKLKVGDVLGNEYVCITEKKTNKKKRFLLNKKMQKEIEQYVLEQELSNEDYLIPSHRMNKKGKYVISRERAYRVLSSTAKKVGITEIGTHSLRKTFGYWHYKQYHDLAMLQELFNHSAPSITLRYIGIREEDINATMKNFYL